MQRLLAIIIVISCSSILSLVLNIRVLHAKRYTSCLTTKSWGVSAIYTEFAGIDSICCEGDGLVLTADFILEWTFVRILWSAERKSATV